MIFGTKMATVYKYLSPDLQECYVGSTTDEDRRKSKHKSNSNTCSSKLLFEKYGYDNCSYVVLEVCPIEEKRIKEQWWLDHAVGAVNDRKALRTEEEFREQKKASNQTQYEANKETILAQQKAHYEANKEKILARKKAYREAHKEQIKARTKAYREAHKEQINARMKVYREAHKAQTKTI